MTSPPTTLTGDQTTPEPEGHAPDAAPVTPPTRFPHLRALDGLRGLAVVLVVFSHFTPDLTPGGFLGVDLFFLLSGFLITSLLVSEWDGNRGIALGRFWVRRARRLFPALLLVLAVVGVHGLLFASPSENHQLGLDGLASLFYVANWRFIASGQSYVMQFIQTDPSPLRHMWSLAIEEQFYVLWPLVVLATGAVVRKLGLRGRHGRVSVRPALAVVSIVLAVASAAWMVFLYRGGADLDRLYYGTDTRVFMILVGAAIGAVAAGRPQVPQAFRVPVIALGSLGVILLLVATFGVETSDEWLYAGGYAGLALLFAVMLLGAGQQGRNPLGRVLGVRPLVGMGLISYGVYLWHWPITVWVTEESTGLADPALFVLRSALTLGASLASYHLIEQPIRHHGLEWGGKSRLWVTPVAVAALSLGFLLPVILNPAIPEAPKSEASTPELAAAVAGYASGPRCDVDVPPTAFVEGPALKVQLIGNSLAGEIRPCLRRILEVRGATVETVATGLLLCDEVPGIQAEATDPATRPDAAVFFAFIGYDGRCGEPWHGPIDRLIDTWLSNGTQVFLVPSVTVAPGGRDDLAFSVGIEEQYYAERAASDPRITVVDAGKYMRGLDGIARWQMPCSESTEAGCQPDGTVDVRFTDGVHFCTDAAFATASFEIDSCPDPSHAAGQRRVTTAIAEALVPFLAGLDSRSSATGGSTGQATAG